MEHTKEPWIIDEQRGFPCDIHGADDSLIAQSILINRHANARRIVACVNACAGIPTDVLEKGPHTVEQLAQLAEAEINKLEQQRDELHSQLAEARNALLNEGMQRDEMLAALEEVNRCGNGGAKLSRRASDMVRAAIAKVKGV